MEREAGCLMLTVVFQAVGFGIQGTQSGQGGVTRSEEVLEDTKVSGLRSCCRRSNKVLDTNS